MKIINCEQGTPGWHKARLGIPTASCADQIITPKTGKVSASSVKYAYRLLAERLLNATGTTLDGLQYIERGKLHEVDAVRQYEFTQDCGTAAVGFITNDAGTLGASPDRLIVGKNAGLECKVPASHTHLQYMLEGAADGYKPQVMMQMLVCEFDYVDFYSWHPRMPEVLIHTGRDEPYIRLLSDALDEFTDRLAELEARARTRGIFQPFADVLTPLEAERGDDITAGPSRDDWALEQIMQGNLGG